MKRLVLLGLLLCITLMVADPQRVSYQGKITDADNVGVSGTYDITFRIYDDAIFGARLDLATVSDVPVDKGLFTVYFLVDLTPEQLASELWLDIEFDGERMIPRQLITSEIKAVYSENAGFAVVSDSAIVAVTSYSSTDADSARISGIAYFADEADSARVAGMAYTSEYADSARIAIDAYFSDYADTARVAGIAHIADFADTARIAAFSHYADTAGAVNWDDITGMPDIIMAGMDLQDVLCVAKNGDDATADGSWQLPYLTIGAATTAATGGEAIVVAPGTYTEDVILPANCNFFGYGQGKTIIDGNFTTTSGTCAIENFSVLETGTITINTTTSALNIFTYGDVVVDGDLQAFNFTIWERTGLNPALTVNGGLVSINSGTIKDDAGGGHLVIEQFGGQIVLNTTQVLGSVPGFAIVSSTAGTFNASTSYILNMGGGPAADLSNDGDALTPNTIDNVLLAGDISCGTAVTFVNSYEGGLITGAALMGMKHGGLHRFTQKAQSDLTQVADNDSTLATKSYVDDYSFTRMRVGSLPWMNDSITFVEGERVSLNLSGDSLEIGFAADSNYIYAQDTLSQVAGFWVDGPGIVGGVTKTGIRELELAEADGSSPEYPFHGNTEYWRSAVLIDASELDVTGGDMTSFEINLSDVASTAPNFTWSDFTVWIEPTVATGVPVDPTVWDVTGADEIIAASTLVLPKTIGWHELTLDAPWTYDGTSNLILYFEGRTALATYTADGPEFSNTAMGSSEYMAYGEGIGSYPATITGVANRPDFKFNFTGATWEIGEVNLDNGNIMADGDVDAESFTLNDTSITSWNDLSPILGTGDTLTGSRHDTIVVTKDFKIMGELIADSIQAVGPMIVIDDSIDVDGAIYGHILDIANNANVRNNLVVTRNATVGNDLFVTGNIYGSLAGGIAIDTLETRDSTLADTLVVENQMKIMGELIADSIQAAGDTLFIDELIKTDKRILSDSIYANYLAVGVDVAEFEVHTLGEMVAQNDNASSFRLRGPQHSSEGTDTVQSYAGIFYNDAYSNTSSSGLKTRAAFGANVEMDLSIQGPRQVRISAVDDTQPDGQIRMASRTDLVVHPRALAEQNVGNYLMIDMEDEGLSAGANTSALEMATSSGDMSLNPAGMLYIHDNAKFIGKAKSDLTSGVDNDSTLATKSYVDAQTTTTSTTIDAEIHVAKNGDDGTGDGSIEKPYLTIAAAVSQAAVLQATHTFVSIIIHTGEYNEGIVLENAALKRVWVKGIGTVNLEPAVGNAFQSTTNNDSLYTLKFENITFGAPFVITGAAGSVSFADVVFDNCNWVTGNGGGHGTIDITSVNNFTLKNAYITETITLNNLNWTYIESGQIQGNIVYNCDGIAATPSWGSSCSQLWNGVYFSGAPTMNVSNGASLTLAYNGCRIGAGTAITVPLGALVLAYNSYLRGEWTIDGVLNLRNSQVQGGINPVSSGVVNLDQFDSQIANTSSVPGATIKDALDAIDNSLAFDTLFAGLKADESDTVVAFDNFKVNGELIADSMQAVGDTIFMDDHVKVDARILGDTIIANYLAVGLDEAEFEIHSLGEMVAQNDNASSFRLRGPQHLSEGTDTVQSYAGIFYNDAYSNTSSSGLKTRAAFGANVEMDLSIQGPRQVRISAVDDTQTDGQIRMASRTDLVIHPRTLAEQNVGNYLTIDMEDEGSSAGANTSAIELETSTGDLSLNPAGMLYVHDNAKFIGKAKSDLTAAADNDSTLVTKSYIDSLNAVTVSESDTIYANTKVSTADTIVAYDNMKVVGQVNAVKSTTGGTDLAKAVVASAVSDVNGLGEITATGVHGIAEWSGLEDLTQAIAGVVGETTPGNGANVAGVAGISDQTNTGISVGAAGLANDGNYDVGVVGMSNYNSYLLAMSAVPDLDVAVLGMQNGSTATDFAGFFDGKVKITEKIKSDLTLIGDGDSTLTTKSYVDAQILTGGADDLGNHTATMDLDMGTYNVDSADSVNANVVTIAGSTDHHNLIIGTHLDATDPNLFAAIDAEVDIDTAWAGTETTQGIYNRTNLNHPSGNGPAISAGYNGTMSVISNNAVTGEVIGGNFNALNEGLARTDDLIGVQANSYNDSLGQVTRVYGAKIGAGNLDNGSTDVAYGAHIGMENQSASGTLASSYGMYLATPVNNGTMTHNYGLYIEDHAGIGSSTNYAIYVEDGKTYLGSDLDVGGDLTVDSMGYFGDDITVEGGATILDNSVIDGNLIVTGTILGAVTAEAVTFDTIFTLSRGPEDTIIVYGQQKIYGELIADSIQAVADTIYLDDNVYVAGNIICDTTENTDNDNVVATKSYVDAAIVSGGADNMGNHTATMALDMGNYDIDDADTVNAASILLSGYYKQNITESPAVTGTDYYVNQTIANITTTDDFAAHNFAVIGTNSNMVRGVRAEATGDGDISYGFAGIGVYNGANTSTVPTNMPDAVGVNGVGRTDNGSLSARAVGVYGKALSAQVGNNYGVIGFASSASYSNIGVLAASNASLTQLNSLIGGANGVGLYAYNPGLGYAIYAEGTSYFTDAVTINAATEINGDITLQNNETISNSSDGTIALGGNVTISGDLQVTGTSTIPGHVIGTNVQAWDDDLDDIAALTPTDGNIIVGDGTNWVAEADNVARTSLGLGTSDSPVFGGLEVNGDIVLENDEVISNSSDGTIAFTGDVSISGDITGNQKITGKAKSDLTVGGDNDSTLTTKSYVDALSETATQADNTWYVSKSGDDVTGNGSIAAPYVSLGAAITAATAGDEIIVLAGSYVLTSDLDVNKELTITGVAGQTDIARNSTSAGVTLSASGIVWRNIDIANANTGVALAITSTGTDGIVVENSSLTDGTSNNSLSVTGSDYVRILGGFSGSNGDWTVNMTGGSLHIDGVHHLTDLLDIDAGSVYIFNSSFEGTIDVADGVTVFEEGSYFAAHELNSTGTLVNRMGVSRIGTNKTTTFDNFQSGSQLLSIYASDVYGDDNTDAIYSWIEVDSGDGSGTLRSIVGEVEATFHGSQGADMLNLYGIYGTATQNDQTNIDGNLIGVYGGIDMSETDNGDVPGGYIAGVLGMYETTGRDPLCDAKGALVGVVKDGNNNQPNAAVVAYLEDDEVGGTDYKVGAAFKAMNGRDGATSGFDYGLDLENSDIQNSDIRLSTGAKIFTGSTDPTTIPAGPVSSAPNGSIYLYTGGNGGLYVRESGSWVLK